jgi:prophage regulatory protein
MSKTISMQALASRVSDAPVVPSFDELLPFPKVKQITSLSRSTIYRKIDDETFPRPLKISGSRIAFRASEIHAWLRSQPRAA